MAHVSGLYAYPIKSLDRVELDDVAIAEGGRIALDREYAMFDADGDYVNGRNNDRVFPLRSTFDAESRTVTLEGPDRAPARFHVDDDRAELDAWLSAYFDEPVEVRRAIDRNFNDSAGGLSRLKLPAPGPTIVATATLERVASWFDDLTTDDIRRRLRCNVEIGGVEPFWEDRLFADEERVVEFRIGDVTLYGIMPKPRCRVPATDPETGERHDEFVRVFAERREAEFPEWADADDLGRHIDLEVDHYYYLTVVTRIPRSEVGGRIGVDDPVEVGGERSIRKIL